jgi:hypothetical protein
MLDGPLGGKTQKTKTKKVGPPLQHPKNDSNAIVTNKDGVIVKKPKIGFWVSFWVFVHPKPPCFTVFPEKGALGRKNQKSL